MLTEQSVPPVGEKNRIVPGTLYLVATPIGNLADLSHRAEAVLAGVDFIAAEDTRNSGRLLAGLGIRKPMVSYFEHNKRERGGQICDRLAAMPERQPYPIPARILCGCVPRAVFP